MKDSVLALLNIALLVTILGSFFLINSQGQLAPQKYDPLVDVNDDGVIDIRDIVAIAIHWGSTGYPMNKSQFVRNGFVNEPWWDSGWVRCNQGYNTFNFNRTLEDPDSALVYMMGKNSTSGRPHQIDYGGDVTQIGNAVGAKWQELTHTSIIVYRGEKDGMWNYVRIMIWQVS
jgi:hypothetical protein